MFVDGHAHVWRRARTPQPWIDPTTMGAIDRDFGLDDLARTSAELGVDGTVLVQTAPSATETADLLALVGGAVLGVVGWFDLRDPALADRLADAPAGLLGVRHPVHQDPDAGWLLDPAVGLGFDRLGRAGVPFDLVVRADQLRLAFQAAAAHPHTTFVLDHLGKPPLTGGDLTTWEVELTALATLPNVVAKVSGLAVEADWHDWTPATLARPLDVAIARFGPARLMFGSDWPVVELSGGAERWLEAFNALTASLSVEERDQIRGGTAARVYRVGG